MLVSRSTVKRQTPFILSKSFPVRFRVSKIASSLLLGVFSGVILCSADEVRLNDGSLIRGKISKISDGTLVIEPDFAKGTFQILMNDVENFSTDEQIFLTTASGATFHGNVVPGFGNTIGISSLHGIASAGTSEVAELWRQGDLSPAERALKAKDRRWNFTIEAGMTGQSGTNDSVQALLGFTAINTGEFDVFKLSTTFSYGETNNEKAQDNLHFIADYSDKFYAPLQWYARTDDGYDKVAKQNFFSTSAVGLGWGLIDQKDWELNFRFGGGFRYEAYQDSAELDDVSTPTLDIEFNHSFTAGFGKIHNVINYSPSLNDYTGDYSITHESYFETAYYEDRVGIRIGMSNSYKNRVAVGNDHLESTFYVKIVFKLK